jgi:protein transport protein SEC24
MYGNRPTINNSSSLGLPAPPPPPPSASSSLYPQQQSQYQQPQPQQQSYYQQAQQQQQSGYPAGYGSAPPPTSAGAYNSAGPPAMPPPPSSSSSSVGYGQMNSTFSRMQLGPPPPTSSAGYYAGAGGPPIGPPPTSAVAAPAAGMGGTGPYISGPPPTSGLSVVVPGSAAAPYGGYDGQRPTPTPNKPFAATYNMRSSSASPAPGLSGHGGHMGTGGSPRSNTRVNPNDVPRPPAPETDIMYHTYTAPTRKLPPICDTGFMAVDTGLCSPRYMRATTVAPAATNAIFRSISVPLAIVATPFARPENGEANVPSVDLRVSAPTNNHTLPAQVQAMQQQQALANGNREETPVRCTRCRGYICMFTGWQDQGNKWKCHLCGLVNETPDW